MDPETTQETTPTETPSETLETTQDTAPPKTEGQHDVGNTPADHEDSLDVGNVFTQMAEEEITADAENDSTTEKVTAKDTKATPSKETPEVPSTEKAEGEVAVVKPEGVIEETEGDNTAETPVAKSKEQLDAEQKAIDDVAKASETVTPEKTTEDQSAELLSLLNEKRGETIDTLAGHHFNFSDEQFREIDENPREAIPKLLAGVYLDAVQGSVAAMIGQMPQIIAGVESRKTVDAAAEQQFFEAFPLLSERPEYKEHVWKVSAMHRKLNPKATLEEMIRDVGLQASVAFKLAVPESVRETGKTDTVMPHVPAAAINQAPAATPGVGKGVNPFSQMAEDMIEDDAS